MSGLEVSVVAAYIASWLLEKLKGWSRLAFIRDGAGRINQVVAALLAALAVVGIHFEWQPEAGTLIVTGLSLAAIFTLLIQWIFQYIMQEGWYRLVLKKPAASVPAVTVVPRPSGR